MDVVSFQLPGHGDATLSNMNSLRTQQHFCDVTIVAGGGCMFRGHKVVLAACSVFLRDQFLMNPSSELQVSMFHSSAVVCELLQSCYTGTLQFSAKEIVNYLTTASYLQMEHVVDKCRAVLSQYMQPQNCSPGFHISTSNKSVQTAKSEDPESMPVIVSVRGSDTSGHFEGQDLYGSDVFQVHIIGEDGESEKKLGAAENREAVVVLDDNSQLDTGMEEANAEGRDKDSSFNLRRQGEYREGRGRGFKRRRRNVFKHNKSFGNSQESWCFPTPDQTMGTSGADFQADYQSNQHLTDSSVYFEYGAGEGQGQEIGSDGGPVNFHVEDSSREVGTPLSEHGAADTSVAVVGSTSSVTEPVVCEQCGLELSTKQDLVMHSLETHQLYMCPHCTKPFVTFRNLNRHMMTHREGSKPHCCPLCQKSFTQKSTLYDHMNVHSGERPYVCAYCHISFAHKSAVRRHLLEQHGKTMAQNQLEMQQNNTGNIAV